MTNPDMTPEIADSARDVLALVRASMRNDHEATAAILSTLNLGETRDRLVSMALLTASLMRTVYGEQGEENMARFAREYLT